MHRALLRAGCEWPDFRVDECAKFAETVESRGVRVDCVVVAVAWLRRRTTTPSDRGIDSMRAISFFSRSPDIVATIQRIGMPQCSSIRLPRRC